MSRIPGMSPRSKMMAILVSAAVSFALTEGCAEREPVTIVFTGDTQGRLVPAG